MTSTNETSYRSGSVVSSMVTLPDRATMLAQAHLVGVPADVADAAVENLTTLRAAGVVISGKLASGKDTIAASCAEKLAPTGADIHQTSSPMRAELREIIRLVADSATIGDATDRVIDAMRVPAEAAAHMAATLFEVTRDPESLPNPDERTDLNRHLLVYHADFGRRAVDPQYWTHQFFQQMYATLAEGRYALLTGCRYPNEIGPAQSLGLMTVRLQVSRKVQEERLWGRDGLTPNPAALDDPNECALDDYVGFNLVVGNDDDAAPTIATVLSHVERHMVAMSVAERSSATHLTGTR